jgi:glycosyltransferase involved in cell wall biosynthesis
MTTAISVIVPVYNTEKYLRTCIDSIIVQTIFKCIEIILVDDGSTDNSPDVCDEYAARFNNILVIHQKNAGVSAARNAGIKKSVGEYIGFVDSDDLIFPEMYERLYRAAQDTAAEVSFCDYLFCSQESESKISFGFPCNKALDTEFIKDVVYPFLLRWGSLNTCCNKLFSAALIEKYRVCFEEGRAFGEDRLFTINAISKCDCVCYTPYTGLYYRFVPGSATKAPRENLMEDLLTEHKEDLRLFRLLGVGNEIIEAYSGEKLLRHIIAGLHILTISLKGHEKRDAMHGIVDNSEMQSLFRNKKITPGHNFSRYEKILVRFVLGKNIPGLLLVMRLMRIRNGFRGGKK